MIVELISTGSELLLGDTVNTNVSWLAQELNKLGYTIAHQSVVGDNPKRMAEVFQLASTRADIWITYHLTTLTNADAPLNSEPLKCAKPSKRLSS